MTNDQHQEYVDKADPTGHDTRGPGARLRAKVEAEGFRRLADQVEAEWNGWGLGTDPWGDPVTAALSVTRLRAEADRLDPKED